MKFARNIVLILVLAGFSFWLFENEQAAQPGRLSSFHRENAVCQDCHIPWRGVSNDMCLNCHDFYDLQQLKPMIRFHEAERLCLECHTEHVPLQKISKMDHTLLNPDLACTACHLDPHDGQFGENCRACHGIQSWNIAGFHHPLEDRGNCNKCHRAPLSHTYEGFQSMIAATHPSLRIGETKVELSQCWRCHIIHDWRHLRMRSELKKRVSG